jgi:putative transposase
MSIAGDPSASSGQAVSHRAEGLGVERVPKGRLVILIVYLQALHISCKIMGSTYASILLHYIFAPKGRENMLHDDFREELHKYITGIVANIEHSSRLLAIGSVEDHIHLLASTHPMIAPAKFIQTVKANSSRFINEKKFLPTRFEWQEGYGVFSVSSSQKLNVIRYIRNQREHHAKKTFQDEYLEILKLVGIEFNPEFLFEFYDPSK